MAYIKYKELTKYFNFHAKLPINELPKYALDYVDSDEKVLIAYRTSRDKAIFTDKRMILFDVTPFVRTKKIHIIPYKSISSSAISFSLTNSAILLSLDSGYQMRLNFVRMDADDKTDLRHLYSRIMEKQK